MPEGSDRENSQDEKERLIQEGEAGLGKVLNEAGVGGGRV